MRPVRAKDNGAVPIGAQRPCAHPLYAVYCVGADNSFGHPRSSVVERYEGMGAKTLRTDRDGAIVFRTDGTHLSVSTYAAEKFLRD